MLEEKVNRKRAEVDLQLLANRIALLRAEEQRALQKVSETKDRAKEILEIKRKKEQHENEKQAKNISREMAIKEAQQRTIMEREARKKRIASSKKVRTRSTPDHFQQAACTKLILNHNLPSSCTTAN